MLLLLLTEAETYGTSAELTALIKSDTDPVPPIVANVGAGCTAGWLARLALMVNDSPGVNGFPDSTVSPVTIVGPVVNQIGRAHV
jgi:hypothetical protein